MEKTAKIYYLLNEVGRKKDILAGEDGRELKEIETAVTPELLEFASVLPNGAVVLCVGFRPYEGSMPRDGGFGPIELERTVAKMWAAPGWKSERAFGVHRFSEPQTVASLLEWERGRRERLETLDHDLVTRFEQEFLEHQRVVAEREEEEARTRAYIQKEREEEERRRAEERRQKAAWIEEHGSDYLKRGFRLGYPCEERYAVERCALELPDFFVDAAHEVKYDKHVDSPSAAAVEVLERLLKRGYRARAVRVTHPVAGFSLRVPVEAIMVEFHGYKAFAFLD